MVRKELTLLSPYDLYWREIQSLTVWSVSWGKATHQQPLCSWELSNVYQFKIVDSNGVPFLVGPGVDGVQEKGAKGGREAAGTE